MDPMTVLALADAALGMIEKLAPHITALFQKGDITAEQQKAVMDRIESIRATGGAFTRPPGVE